MTSRKTITPGAALHPEKSGHDRDRTVEVEACRRASCVSVGEYSKLARPMALQRRAELTMRRLHDLTRIRRRMSGNYAFCRKVARQAAGILIPGCHLQTREQKYGTGAYDASATR